MEIECSCTDKATRTAISQGGTLFVYALVLFIHNYALIYADPKTIQRLSVPVPMKAASHRRYTMLSTGTCSHM